MTTAQRPLGTLDILAAAGIEGDDAITALDTLLARLGAELVDVHPEDLMRRFGSDACRPARTLAVAAEIRAELTKAAIDGPDLDAAIIGTLKLMRAGQIGAHEAIDTTLDARRDFLLEGDDQDTEGDPR